MLNGLTNFHIFWDLQRSIRSPQSKYKSKSADIEQEAIFIEDDPAKIAT